MYLQSIKNLMTSRNIRRSELAKRARVSRAAVTKWFRRGEAKGGWVNVETSTLLKLAEAFQVSPVVLLTPRADLSLFRTSFLWDRLYPNMERFVKALAEGRPEALARLVQIVGFWEASRVCGRRVFTLFEQYKKYIHPGRRKGLEAVWPIYAGRE